MIHFSEDAPFTIFLKMLLSPFLLLFFLTLPFSKDAPFTIFLKMLLSPFLKKLAENYDRYIHLRHPHPLPLPLLHLLYSISELFVKLNSDLMAVQLKASSSISSVFSTRSYTHDVFLSFRGEDTRYGFTDHLHRYLVLNRINTFIDDGLTKGEEILPALLRTIEGSKLSLIVFSETYASSKWCLDELVHILECKRSKDQMVRPIFYKVDPSDVRNQRGTYGEALAEHERRCKHDKDKVLRWRTALSDAASLTGWHFSGGLESKFIDKIVEEVSAQVKEPTTLDVARCPVGIDSRVQDMLEILDVGGSDVRMIGIWGTGGIGKTTIAKAVYNTIAHKFVGSCFLANVREESEQHGGLVNLQNVLLSHIVGQKGLKINNVHEGITLLRESLRHKRILLVVDDVDSLKQLEKLVGGTNWFGRGSRVIITTRDKHLLITHQVKPIYKIPELVHHEALKLFSSNAFKDSKSLDDNEKLLVGTMVKYAQGIPLALEVLGSSLFGTPIHKWQTMLDGFRRKPPKRIQGILKISYDGLEDTEQKVFLDIACFFKDWKINDVIQILEGCDRINPVYSIKVLEEKALICVDSVDYIRMHDLLEEIGKDTVQQESTEPGERSRLWHHKDVQDVLTENTGTSKIEGMLVKLPAEDKIHLSPKCFKKMKNLKIFINVNARFCGKVDYLPNQLRLLDWPKCPLHSLPSNLNMKNIVQLSMLHSRISHLGEGFKSMQNLKSLNLSYCEFLEQIPDLSGSPNLEFLDLRECKHLVEIHPSVGSLEKLVHLDLHYCSNLVTLPREVNWRSLQRIGLYGCAKLESFPEIVGEMKYMTSLSMYGSAIKALPSSIRYLVNLERLNLRCCRNLIDLPVSIYELRKLKSVDLSECPKLETIFPNKVESVELPTYSKVSHNNFDSLSETESDDEGCRLSNLDFLVSLGCASTLTDLDLSESTIVILSECIIKLVNLRSLNLNGCMRLVEIPELPSRLKWLDVRNCVSLERISNLSNIWERKEPQIMIERMDLTNCWRLCENLVEMANVKNVEFDDDLFSELLSSQRSAFTIQFPVQKSEIPKWFSCQTDYRGYRRFEFYVEMLENFKWENTGLAICVAAADQIPLRDPISSPFWFYIYINEVRFEMNSHLVMESNHVVLYYTGPFAGMWRFGYMRPLPPFTCRVVICRVDDPFQSCGVHLVMSPDEVSMKLIRAENLSDDLFAPIEDSGWDTYLPKQRTDCKELYTDALLENEKV